MAVTTDRRKTKKKRAVFSLCPFWQTGSNNTTSSSASSTQNLSQAYYSNNNGNGVNSGSYRHGEVNGNDNKKKDSSKTVSLIARSLLPARRRLRLDPSNNLYFPYEAGKQVQSAIRLKNTSKSHVAFKFQTTAPKSCFMRPPGGILAPGEILIATVFKFVELPENNEKVIDQKSKVKFKIMSLKVNGGTEYVPELFDEQKDQVTVERIMRVVFLDVEHPSPALEKLKRQLAEAEAADEARKKPPPDSGPRVVGEGLVIDEWKERREKYLARQKVEAVDSA
ncbi:vesicle-associated protein 4-1-like [Mercurialis annua]|uniref:vesicle-associated protein 4-1-like n=1 Tax=Mercurialis annua TaxID=3986 RepID=UPI0021605464|nr:vesicle-associated protein 4-1-like [Mercurialis annua]